jgi:hypothetical protein
MCLGEGGAGSVRIGWKGRWDERGALLTMLKPAVPLCRFRGSKYDQALVQLVKKIVTYRMDRHAPSEDPQNMVWFFADGHLW